MLYEVITHGNRDLDIDEHVGAKIEMWVIDVKTHLKGLGNRVEKWQDLTDRGLKGFSYNFV